MSNANNNPLLIPNIFFYYVQNFKINKNNLPQNNKKSNIFDKFINNKSRLVPFTKLVNSVGKPRYSPAISKE